MKKLIPILLLFALLGVFSFSITNPKFFTTEISVVRDITDLHQAKPVAGEIYNLYDLENNMYEGAVFHFSDLSDVSYNPKSEVKLNPENKWFSNELERADQIKVFKNRMISIVSDSLHETIGKKYSSVYFPIANELRRLNESRSQRKILLIYSDLMQNDLEVSLYSKKEFDLLQSNPDSLEKYFENLQPLPSLEGIEIYIVYHPSDVAKDMEFRIVSEFYRKMFEQKGGRVIISANLAN